MINVINVVSNELNLMNVLFSTMSMTVVALFVIYPRKFQLISPQTSSLISPYYAEISEYNHLTDIISIIQVLIH